MFHSFGPNLPNLPVATGPCLPIVQSPPQQSTIAESMPSSFHNLPSILDLRLHEWIRKLTNPISGVFPNGISPKQMEALAHAQWAAALRSGRDFRPAWRGSNHLSALLSNEVRAGRLMRLQKACYIGCDAKIKQTQTKKEANEALASRLKQHVTCSMCRCKIDGQREVSLKCKTCLLHVHAECGYNQRRVPLKLVTGSKDWFENWQCLNCKRCNICDSPDKKEGLLCQTCDSMEHARCQSSIADPLFSSWNCSLCTKSSTPAIPTVIGDSKNIQMISIPTPETSHSESPTDERQQVITAETRFRVFPNLDVQSASQSLTPNLDGQLGNGNCSPAEIIGLLARSISGESAIEELKETAKNIAAQRDDSCRGEATNLNGVKGWSVDQVAQYFQGQGYPETASAFKREEVDGSALLLMERSDVFTRLGLKMGPALKTYKLVRRLRKAVSAMKKEKTLQPKN